MAKFLQRKFLPGAIALLLVGGFFVFGTNKASADNSGLFFANETIADSGVSHPERGWTSNDSYVIFNNNSDNAEYGFPNLGIPAGSTIDGIEVLVEGRRDGTTQNRNFTAALWNASNGSSYTSTQTATFSGTDTIQTLGSPTFKWGRTWVVGDFTDATFKIKIGNVGNHGDAKLDAVQVRVYYTPAPVLATLTLVKSVINDNGGSAAATAWTLSASGASPISGTTGSGAVTAATVTPGTYTLSESVGPFGYTASTYSCVKNGGGAVVSNSITLAGGDVATCTITNDDQAGQLTIVKNTVGGDGLFLFEVSGPSASTPDIQTSSLTGTTGAFAVNAGTYSVAEGGQGTWDLTSATCNDGSSWLSGSTVSNINIPLGANVTCTFTNTKRGQITVSKDVVAPNGETDVSDSHSFNVTLNGGNQKTISEGASKTYSYLVPGTYTIAEIGDPDFDLLRISGDNDTDASNGALVVVTPGQDTAVTITNAQKQGHLTVIKHVVNHDIGTASAADFTMTVEGNNVSPSASFPGNEDGAIVTLNPGGYAVSEHGPQDQTYYAISMVGDCRGAITSNGSAICTITNSEIPIGKGAITVVKDVKNDNGGTATPANFTLQITPADGQPITVESDKANFLDFDDTYTVSEIGGPSGYTQTGINCVSGLNSNNGTILLGEQQAWVCTITNDDIAPVLTLNKNVIKDNGGTAVAGDWTLTATGPVTLSGAGSVTSDATFKAGFYHLSESGGPAGYTAGEWICEGGSMDGDGVALALGQQATCTITNNDQRARLRINKYTDGGDDGTFNFSIRDINDDHEFSRSEQLTTVGGSASTDGYIQLDAATYDVTESAPEGWTLSSVLCNYGETQSIGDPIANGKRIVVGNGDSITCSFNNTKRVITYSWVTADWGSCSASCGGGTQTREVVCQGSNQQIDTSGESCPSTKPATSQNCNAQSCGGGGGGGFFTPSPCVSVDYYDWQTTCVNNLQFRDIKALVPEGCQMTQAQRDAGQRPCGTGGQVLGEKIVGELAPGGICDDAPTIATGQVDSMLDLMKVKRNPLSEKNAQDKYIKRLLSLVKDKKLTQANINALINYVAYSGPRSLYLGAGERAGVLHSYLAAFNRLPRTEDEWCDVVKIATGRWTIERSDGSEQYAQDAFKSKVYKRDPKMDDQVDQNAVMVISYGLRPNPRSLEKESLATKIFKGILKRLPQGARDWDMVRAIAYSGAEQ